MLLAAVDRLRGLVMIVMALDHVRDYFSSAEFNPTDPAQTTPAYFATRWVTHFCAPVFMLLAGSAVALRERHKGRAGLAAFVAKRGAFLVLLEVTVVHVGWKLDLHYPMVRLMVIWALGGAMLTLALLLALRLSVRAIACFGAVVVLGHNLLDGVHPSGAWSLPWSLLHQPAEHPLVGAHQLFVLYPLVPWIGVMALGYALGAILSAPEAQRDRALRRLGLGLVLGFALLRFDNRYGDPHPWTSQPRGAGYTLLSFLNLEKYPPSLDYLLATLGPALLALPLLERLGGRAARLLEIFGRVPLFFYVLHIYVIHLLALLLSIEVPLAGVYAVWLGVTLALIVPCAWYGRFKARRRDLAILDYL